MGLFEDGERGSLGAERGGINERLVGAMTIGVGLERWPRSERDGCRTGGKMKGEAVSHSYDVEIPIKGYCGSGWTGKI